MYSITAITFRYILYCLRSLNGKGHGIHSPFVYDFVENVLNDNRFFYAYHEIEKVRAELLQNNEVLKIEDFGAGSRVLTNRQRKVASIAASSLKPRKYARLLFRMVNHFQPVTILEIGTSLGITTAYLASANPFAKVFTLEGASMVARIAEHNFSELKLHNIELVYGNFDDTLPVLIKKIQAPDFVFIDGNHRYQPTMDYFKLILSNSHDYTIIILDDIHWSKEMELAWDTIKANDSVTMTIDLFYIGIVLFRKEFKVKQHFTVHF